MNRRGGLLVSAIVVLLVLAGGFFAYNYFSGVKKVAEVKSDDYVGKKVKIRGVVESAIKVGTFSGYYLHDDTGKIFVASKSLPEEGSKVTVEGVVMKELIVGYYLNAS